METKSLRESFMCCILSSRMEAALAVKLFFKLDVVAKTKRNIILKLFV